MLLICSDTSAAQELGRYRTISHCDDAQNGKAKLTAFLATPAGMLSGQLEHSGGRFIRAGCSGASWHGACGELRSDLSQRDRKWADYILLPAALRWRCRRFLQYCGPAPDLMV